MNEIRIETPTEEQLSERGVRSWGTWEKEPSEFDWSYTAEEHCYVIQGRAVITHESGAVEISEGNYVVFPAGLKCTWKVTEPIRKYYTFK
jgi:hypothetical protein